MLYCRTGNYHDENNNRQGRMRSLVRTGILSSVLTGNGLLKSYYLTPNIAHGSRIHKNYPSCSCIVRFHLQARTVASIGDDITSTISTIESSMRDLGVNTSVKLLSTDPIIYSIPNFLSSRECDVYQEYIYFLSFNKGRTMTRSNPPQVSLDVKKLWPLLLLSILSGIIPYRRLLTTSNHDLGFREVALFVFPDVLICLVTMGILGYMIILPLLRTISNASSRTSDAIALNLEEDLTLIRPFVDRATASVSMSHLSRSYSWQNWESPVVTRYDIGSVFARHGDASSTRGSEWKDSGGQRLVTCICYLNSLHEGDGGETYFDKLKLDVRPQKGTALFFYPANALSWEADDRMTHESLPPSKEKWIVQLFGRAERVPSPLGLPNDYVAEA